MYKRDGVRQLAEEHPGVWSTCVVPQLGEGGDKTEDGLCSDPGILLRAE